MKQETLFSGTVSITTRKQWGARGVAKYQLSDPHKLVLRIPEWSGMRYAYYTHDAHGVFRHRGSYDSLEEAIDRANEN